MPAPNSVDDDRYRVLKRSVANLGHIRRGSVVRRFMPCGKPGCCCQAAPPQLHGPYYQWTRKVGGKTEARMLSESLVRLYREGIRNHRRLDAILEQMRKISLLAFDAAKIHPKL